jgi:hypothetical protein
MDNIKNNQQKKTPIWVLLAFSSIHKRKHAIILIWASIIFTLYCLPWSAFINNEIISTLFLIDDWSWIAMMIPICIWYILCLRWMDNNNGWKKA